MRAYRAIASSLKAARPTPQPTSTRTSSREDKATIKLIAFELDYTLWHGRLDKKYWGKGRGASFVIEDNLELVDGWVIRDKSDENNYITLHRDVPGIIHDIHKRGIQIAVVSRNTSKNLCDRALWHYKANDKHDETQPIISLVTYDEVKNESKVEPFKRIKEWSGLDYREMLLFDSDSSGSEVHKMLGVNFKQLSRSTGLSWKDYKEALNIPSDGKDPYDTPFYGLPPLGKLLGFGKFGTAYDIADDPDAVIKVTKYWVAELRPRFLEIYKMISAGKPFESNGSNDDQYLLMIAFELCNLRDIGQLKAPSPEHYTGWFTITKIRGALLWKTPIYKSHPFSMPFQRLLRTACHLAVDEIEEEVKKHGIEHLDAHLGNVMFTMEGDKPVKAHLFDWGLAVRTKWDGCYYIRGEEIVPWGWTEPGARYTAEEFRRYWITWMVKTEYEANMKRQSITQEDGMDFLKDLSWWFRRD
ncbi:hypothetical protein AX16_003771 [Volvariella volvacea WC 439]|nr:hypothetical protein AX16_003771 [Volvariella volvacea WC 439]